MHAFDPVGWSGFFTAMVGASAALIGLLFVAVALNLDHILKGPTFLPSRAAETWRPCNLAVYNAWVLLVEIVR